MKRRGIFICFAGIDGSGKTTLAKLLTKSLNENGFPCKYVYGGFLPVLWKPFMSLGNLLLLRKKNRFKDYRGYVDKKRNLLKRHPLWTKMYRDITILDCIPQLFLKVELPLRHGVNVICDRYFYDTIINMAPNLSYGEDEICRIIAKWTSLFPKPDQIFLLDVSEKVAYSRKNDIPNIEYLRERRYLYLHMAQSLNAIILDGTKSLEYLINTMQEVILSKWNTK